MKVPSDIYARYLMRAITLMVVGCACMTGGCATHNAELKQEIEVLLKQTMAEVKSETRRMDADMEQIRSEVMQLRSEVGHVDAKVGRVETQVGRIGSDVTLLQTDAEKSDASLVDLAVRVNQLDRRVGKTDNPAAQHDGRIPQASEAVAPPAAPSETASVVAPGRIEMSKQLQHGMSEQDVIRLFGNPHGIEKVLDSIYWYYGDGELQGEYVRFDAKNGKVNGWSIVSPPDFQLDLRTTQGGHVR
jgi:septal ring factor EnvC (AmiA/AmiB activator)